MVPKKVLRSEARVECLCNCRYYNQCMNKMGRKCKHLGGRKIPVFKLR